MPPLQPTFQELMDRVRLGCEESFQLAISRYGDAIRREIRFTLLDAQVRRVLDDSDVYQSVVYRFYLGMCEGRFQLSSPADLVNLLKGIVRIRVAELVRHWHAQKRDVSLSRQIDRIPVGSLPSQQPQNDCPAENLELLALVKQHLPEADQEILRLRHHGLTWNEIALSLGAGNPDTLRKQHERMLARVADNLRALANSLEIRSPP